MGAKPMELPDIQILRECFDVDFDKGILIWKERPISHFTNLDRQKKWNTRYAKKIAGFIDVTTGYKRVKIFKVNYTVHRIIYCLFTGDISLDLEIDHIDQNKANNKISNLRLVTAKTNSRNKKLYTNNKSGTKGVFKKKKYDRWFANISGDNGKKVHLGSFIDIKDAIKARKDAELLYGYLN